MKFSINNIRDLPNLIRELTVGFNRLSLEDNTESFKTIVTILPSTVKQIAHNLGFIPSERIILRQDVEAAISDSATTWDDNFVYLENHNGSNTVTLTVIFMR